MQKHAVSYRNINMQKQKETYSVTKETFRNMQKYTETFRNIEKDRHIEANTETYKNMQKYAETCGNVEKHTVRPKHT